jgi:hypothetical protein
MFLGASSAGALPASASDSASNASGPQALNQKPRVNPGLGWAKFFSPLRAGPFGPGEPRSTLNKPSSSGRAVGFCSLKCPNSSPGTKCLGSDAESPVPKERLMSVPDSSIVPLGRRSFPHDSRHFVPGYYHAVPLGQNTVSRRGSD